MHIIIFTFSISRLIYNSGQLGFSTKVKREGGRELNKEEGALEEREGKG